MRYGVSLHMLHMMLHSVPIAPGTMRSSKCEEWC